jgi:DNA/RNA-binding domain of Phe-tRNA-synthetase-like protein
MKTLPSIKVNEEVISRLGSLRLGIVNAELEIRDSSDDFKKFLKEEYKQISGSLQLNEVSSIPNVSHSRKAYKNLGADPNRYRLAADALLRRIVKRKELAFIYDAVDVLNFISVSSGISISGFDAEKIVGEICLGRGETGESYTGIGRGEMNISQLPVFRDDEGGIGTPTSDSTRTMITANTRRALFVFYDFGKDPTIEKHIKEFIKQLEKNIIVSEISYQLSEY